MKRKLFVVLPVLAFALVGCQSSSGKIVGTASMAPTTTESPTPSVTADPKDLLAVEKAIPDCSTIADSCQELTVQLRTLCDVSNTAVAPFPPDQQAEIAHAFEALCPAVVAADATPAPVDTPPAPMVTTPPPPPPVQPVETVSQAQAVGKAQEYLSIGGFSRQGLIDQLVFDEFSTTDATYAVDKINPDWNAEAAQKAKEYLGISSFSHQGLVDQLTFDGFTPAQAEYGVSQNGL